MIVTYAAIRKYLVIDIGWLARTGPKQETCS